MNANYLASTPNPQLAQQIKSANPGSFIQSDPHTGIFHIYTIAGHIPKSQKITPKTANPKKTAPVIDYIIYGCMTAAILLLLFSK